MIVIHAVFSSTINYSMMRTTASESCASMMLHSFSILSDPVSCQIRCSYRRRLEGSPGTTRTFCDYEMVPRSVEIGTVTFTNYFLFPTSFGCRSRKGWCAGSLRSPNIVPTLYPPRLAVSGRHFQLRQCFGIQDLSKHGLWRAALTPAAVEKSLSPF